MEGILKNMDDFHIHVAPFPRLHSLGRNVESIGLMTRKSVQMNTTFSTLNFSVIFEGEGEFNLDGRRWPVKAPCVITQWPRIHAKYGPFKHWEELYMVYSAENQPLFEAMNMASRQRPVWSFGDPGPVRKIQAQIATLISRLGDPGVVDRLDRLCDLMIVETHLGSASIVEHPQEMEIRKIRAMVDAQPLENHDFEALAYEHGFSPANLRRHWEKYVGTPPWRYVMQLRIQQACRLLAETRLPIGEIALRLKFQDPLYFSRVFRSITRQTARDYRRQHQSTLPPDRRQPDTKSPSINPRRPRR